MNKNQILKSSIDGYIERLIYNTINGGVTNAEEVMKIETNLIENITKLNETKILLTTDTVSDYFTNSSATESINELIQKINNYLTKFRCNNF